MRMRALLGLWLLTACSNVHEPERGDLLLDVEVELGNDGLSEALELEVPEGARSITVLIEGSPSAVYGLRRLTLGGEVALEFPLDITSTGFQYGFITLGPGGAQSFLRLGSFVHTYPTLESQPLPAGRATLQIVSSIPSEPARVRVFAPVGEGTELHVSVISATPDGHEAELATATEVLASAGITLIVDERVPLVDETPITLGAIPQPGGPGVERAALERSLLSTDALPLIFIELENAQGVSLGLPASPAGGDYFAVLIDPTNEWFGDRSRAQGRVIAHELAHSLGLFHLENPTPTGDLVPDAFDDTEGFEDTLMGSVPTNAPISEISFRVSPMQAYAMSRSPLLR